jgi:hypothetical protein
VEIVTRRWLNLLGVRIFSFAMKYNERPEI